MPAITTFELFWIFLKLGLTSFGGPVAHLGYFRVEFVEKRQWLDERSYADLVALCQFLPGPSSSQVGMGIGLLQKGLRGALAAWVGFTLPSALLLLAFALCLTHFPHLLPSGALHGLKIVAVAVVAQAVWSMGKSLCPDKTRIALMLVASMISLGVGGVYGQLSAIALGACVGLLGYRAHPIAQASPLTVRLSKASGVFWLCAFAFLLLLLPLFTEPLVALANGFYRAGALIFGGGHVMLPLLQAETVATGWVDNDVFLAGYGAAQAVPGPLISFAAFLGAQSNLPIHPLVAALVCVTAICLPAFCLIAGALPFWESIRQKPLAQAALCGVNASVVGLLLAALYQPVWVSAIFSFKDVALAGAAWLCLVKLKMPPWLLVVACALVGALLGF